MSYKFQELPYSIITWRYIHAKNTNRKSIANAMLKPFFRMDKHLKQSANSVFLMVPYDFDDLRGIIRIKGNRNPQIREIILFKNAVVFKTVNHGDLIFKALETATNVKSSAGNDYFKLEHYDPSWGTMYVFYSDVRFDKPGYKWWEDKEDKESDENSLYVVFVYNDGAACHHIIKSGEDELKSFIDSIGLFPGLSKYEYERFGWWFNNKVRRGLINAK